MTQPWAARLPETQIASLGALRLTAGIEACQCERDIWLRGDWLDEALDLALRSLPAAERFAALPDGQLAPWGRQVPAARLPDQTWQPLSSFLEVTLPTPGLGAASRPKPAPLRLVRCQSVREPSLLLTDAQTWRGYGIEAPQARLERWKFAAASDLRVLVQGAPLPPIPGTALVVQSGVAAPAGWTWSPPLDAEVVREALSLLEDDLAILWPDGSWERIGHEQWVSARRSAIRELPV